jgi:hypothetical protein
MQSLSAQAASLGDPFSGFDVGLGALRRDLSQKLVIVVTVFNRVVEEDSGLRFKVIVPVSVAHREGMVNLLSTSLSDEVVVTKDQHPVPFTVEDMCKGMDFVLPSASSFIPADSLRRDMIGVYLMPYYVQEIRIMYSTCEIANGVYDRHAPIFENICGFVPAGQKVSRKKALVCVHGNIVFKGYNALFKGVRDVNKITETIMSALGVSPAVPGFDPYVSMSGNLLQVVDY